MGKDSLGGRDSDLLTRLVLSVGDLAVVDNESVTASALTEGPTELLGESGINIREEELVIVSFVYL